MYINDNFLIKDCTFILFKTLLNKSYDNHVINSSNIYNTVTDKIFVCVHIFVVIGEVCGRGLGGGAKPPPNAFTEVIKTAKSRLLHVPKHPYGSIMS